MCHPAARVSHRIFMYSGQNQRYRHCPLTAELALNLCDAQYQVITGGGLDILYLFLTGLGYTQLQFRKIFLKRKENIYIHMNKILYKYILYIYMLLVYINHNLINEFNKMKAVLNRL